jgi:hypothetical protein
MLLRGIGFLGILVVLLLGAIVSSFLFPYTVNAWLLFAKREPVVQWWMGFLIGCIPGIAELVVPAAIITWLIMLFI